MIENNALKINLENDALGFGKGMGKLSDAFFRYMGLRSEQKHEIKLLDIICNGQLSNNNNVIEYHDKNLSITSIPTIEERAHSRESFNSIRKQENLEKVVHHAHKELNDESEVSDEPLDNYWLTRFFEMASNVSGEDMQIIWGKILAGEIQQPDTYSIRALETLCNLTTKEAGIFNKISSYILSWGEYTFLLAEDELLDKYGVNYHDLMTLEDCGLLNTTILDIEPDFSDSNIDCIKYDKYTIIMKLDGNNDIICDDISIPIYRITQVGVQIYGLFLKQPNMDYLFGVMREINKRYLNKCPNISMSIVQELDDGNFSV